MSNITTDSIIEDLMYIARYPQNYNAPHICRLAADRLKRLEHELEMARAERDANVKAYIALMEKTGALD